MLYVDFNSKLLGLEDVIIKSIENNCQHTEISIEMQEKAHCCPCCQSTQSSIHDYRTQRIRDIPSFGKQVTLILRKRRYRCKHCGKRYAEVVSFLPRYYRMTNRLSAYVFDSLAGTGTFTDIAKEIGISTPTVMRIFDVVNYPTVQALPRVLAIDEFKGNTHGEQYQCILTDVENKVVLDILPTRHETDVQKYLRKCNREKVAYFVSDMWQPYARIASTLLPKATQLVDKYHYVRQAVWAFEAVRKQEQKKFSDTHRRYFKRSKRILTMRESKLTDEGRAQLNVMLYASATLSSAHFLKEKFLAILDEVNSSQAKAMFSKWILTAQNSDILQFQKCADTFIHWSKGILNTFDAPYTNGFTEGCNNKIKVLKRNAYGYRNFKRFRNRILHMFAYQHARYKKEAAA